ncbi:hypothetical protein [Streptomyces sp. NEAU-Y11]|uniref:hypothetical protein n=1 Tax=Streptomyces cucumeris TaxID=2962890 RepID=UPI0020C842F7|nr:hypothetical protein [Streptomyces sp. NEAU-Y11]MCP9213460.1 hypothetical protein [Streptomyces sp. NEAU-Y11]
MDGEALPTPGGPQHARHREGGRREDPGFGEGRKKALEEIAVLTGGKVISKDKGMELEKVTLEDLGTARHIVVTRDKTVISDKPIPDESVPPLVETTDEVTPGGLVIAKEPFSDAS